MGNDYDDLGPGEIRRGFARIEKQVSDLSIQMTNAIGPFAEVRFRGEQHEKDINQVCEKVRTLEAQQRMSDLRSAAIGGGAAVVMLVVKFVFFK